MCLFSRDLPGCAAAPRFRRSSTQPSITSEPEMKIRLNLFGLNLYGGQMFNGCGATESLNANHQKTETGKFMTKPNIIHNRVRENPWVTHRCQRAAQQVLGRWFTVVATGLLMLLAAGCSPGDHEEAEHHFAPHLPVNFQAAVARLQVVHQEITGGPLTSREVKSSRKQHHAEGEDDEYSTLDPLEEMEDLVGWLPDFAADSELTEEPWNQVDAGSKRLGGIITRALSQNEANRRDAYLKEAKQVENELRQLQEISKLLPSAETPGRQNNRNLSSHKKTQRG